MIEYEVLFCHNSRVRACFFVWRSVSSFDFLTYLTMLVHKESFLLLRSWLFYDWFSPQGHRSRLISEKKVLVNCIVILPNWSQYVVVLNLEISDVWTLTRVWQNKVVNWIEKHQFFDVSKFSISALIQKIDSRFNFKILMTLKRASSAYQIVKTSCINAKKKCEERCLAQTNEAASSFREEIQVLNERIFLSAEYIYFVVLYMIKSYRDRVIYDVWHVHSLCNRLRIYCKKLLQINAKYINLTSNSIRIDTIIKLIELTIIEFNITSLWSRRFEFCR